MWSCPECGREFAKARQWHSCAKRSVGAHFAGKDPAVRRVFDRLTRRLKSLGPFRMDAVKTSINLVAKHHFGGVTVRKDSLRVGFLASERIDDPRIAHTLRLGANRVGHSVVLRSPEDVDDQLMSWLARAYELQSGQR